MKMLLIFFSALLVGFSGAMMPGSLLTYTIRKSLSSGPWSGFVIVAGHAVLELALIVLIMMGFDVVLQSGTAQIAIGIAGGILLVLMGIDMVRNAAKNRIAIKTEGGEVKKGGMFLSGIVISAANPYFLLWWAIIGLGFIMQSYQSFMYAGVAIYFLGHITADVIWYGLISVVVGTTRKFIKEKPYRMVIAVLGLLLVFFGGKFVFGAIAAWNVQSAPFL
jgi:threonine/homoserine/homoserine lactone efflux protein